MNIIEYQILNSKQNIPLCKVVNQEKQFISLDLLVLVFHFRDLISGGSKMELSHCSKKEHQNGFKME